MSIVIIAVIFLGLAGIAVGRIPFFRMNRATIALITAVVLVVLGGISLENAFASLDMDTLALLFAMMVLNGSLKFSGFFRLATTAIIRFAHTPRQFLALVIAVSGLFSALFLNDTICLMLTPLVCGICLTVKRDPIPYLIGLATAANIGSMATIIGNPQNMLIGTASKIPFFTFTLKLIVPSVVGLGAAWLIIALVFRKEVTAETIEKPAGEKVRFYRPLLVKSIIAVCAMIAALIAGVPIALASLIAAAILLITRRIKPERVFKEIDWTILVFFAGLFIITEAVKHTVLFKGLVDFVTPLANQNTTLFAVISAAVSNIISNVPAVMLFRPLVSFFADQQKGWLILAMATTLAGNFTLIGSVANLIVAESAKRYGVHLSFGTYLKAGVPITIVTIAIGIVWLNWM